MAKLKPFQLARQNRPSAASVARDGELSYLRDELKKHAAIIDALCGQVSELNLRMRFVMHQFDWKKGSGIIGPDGRRIVLEAGTMFDYYTLTRDAFLDLLLKETPGASARDSLKEGKPNGPTTVDDADQTPAPRTPLGRPVVQDAGRTSGHHRSSPALILTDQ